MASENQKLNVCVAQIAVIQARGAIVKDVTLIDPLRSNIMCDASLPTASSTCTVLYYCRQ